MLFRSLDGGAAAAGARAGRGRRDCLRRGLPEARLLETLLEAGLPEAMGLKFRLNGLTSFWTEFEMSVYESIRA